MNREVLTMICGDPRYLLGTGKDSNVYFVPPEIDNDDVVVKFYKNIDDKKLCFYRKVTDRVAKLVETEKWDWDCGPAFGELRPSVVPIREITKYNDQMVGISKRCYAKRGDAEKYQQYYADSLWRLSRYINVRIGVNGIDICPVNTRIDKANRVLYITDLCGYIEKLTKIEP